MNSPTPSHGGYPLHVLAIGLHDRPGAVHSVSEVFSGRGLQMETFYGVSDKLSADGHASALILFHANPDRANLVSRILCRLSCVRTAKLLAADDPKLVMSALVANEDIAVPAGIRHIALDRQTALAIGSPAAMRDWLASDNAPRRLGALRLDKAPVESDLPEDPGRSPKF